MATTITWPLDLPPGEATFKLARAGARFSNPWNMAVQRLAYTGEQWQCTLSFAEEVGLNVGRLDSLGARLGGGIVECLLWDFRRETPKGAGSGAPIVAGDGQTGNLLVTTGWTPSTLVLRDGDYIGLGTDGLHMVTGDVTSNAYGDAALSVVPAVATAPADGLALTLTRPTARFYLLDMVVDNRTRPPVISSYTFNFAQVLA